MHPLTQSNRVANITENQEDRHTEFPSTTINCRWKLMPDRVTSQYLRNKQGDRRKPQNRSKPKAVVQKYMGRLHSRPAIPGHQAAGQVLDPADQVCAGPGCRVLRVPGLHGAQSQRACPAASCGSPHGDPGRTGPLREGGQQRGAPLHRARRLGATHVHHVVPRRRATGGRLPPPPHATGSQPAGGLRRRPEHDWLINHRVGQEARYWQLHM
ncbi:uncharacterized protein dpr11 isoform X2 [Drosophila takahashii]|uniref:uncharacterized protein dpr11 isoform X2 n=1 Tax=Drosophila takahashii TaxID=29030 RepID=UPI0038993DAD